MSEINTLTPKKIANFFNLDNCEMYLKWETDEKAKEVLEEKYSDIFTENKGMSPILSKKGLEFEKKQLDYLRDELDNSIFVGEKNNFANFEFDEIWDDENDSNSLSDFIRQCTDDCNFIVLHQTELNDTIGNYEINGKSDIIILEPNSSGYNVHVLEVKNSSEEMVPHRIQATIYAMLFEKFIENNEGLQEPKKIITKVITKNNNLALSEGFRNIDDFNKDPYITQLKLNLRDNGTLAQIFDTSFEDTSFWIDSRCSQCKYEPVCIIKSAETKGLEILGITSGTQEKLKQVGVEDLEDFSNLYHQPGNYTKPNNYESLEPKSVENIMKIRDKTEMDSLQKRTQIGYKFLTMLDCDECENSSIFAQFLQGCGYNFPVDTYDESKYYVDYPSGSLIRIYIFVQFDYVQNRIVLMSALLENTKKDEKESFSVIVDELPDNIGDKNCEEKKVLESFFKKISDKIKDIKPNLSDEGQGFIHLYFFSQRQRDRLVNAIKRHDELNGGKMMRTLLGLREEIDQQMVSIIQEEFIRRRAMSYPGLGIAQTVKQFYHEDDEWFNWKNDVNFKRIFEKGFFKSFVKYGFDNGLEFNISEGIVNPNYWEAWDGNYYPVRNREVDQIPLDYIWGAIEEISPRDFDNPDEVNDYIYKNQSGDRISEEDIKAFSEKICKAIYHIETSIKDWHKDKFVNKEPLDISEITDLSFEERSLADICIEYQQLEYQTNYRSKIFYYRQPIEERLASGKSILFNCTEYDYDPDANRPIKIYGDIVNLNKESSEEEREEIQRSPVSISEGDMILFTPVDLDSNPPEQFKKYDNKDRIAHSPVGFIDTLDMENENIVITSMFNKGLRGSDKPYRVFHYGWKIDDEEEKENKYNIKNNKNFVIDPIADQWNQEKAAYALRAAETNNPIYQKLQRIYENEFKDIKEWMFIEKWKETHVNEFLKKIECYEDFETPNIEQIDLIKDINTSIVTLQGPPGTGKTSHTVAPAILSRVYSSKKDNKKLIVAVSALSHKAVDEALDKTIELLNTCDIKNLFEDVNIYRVGPSNNYNNHRELVDFVNYHQRNKGDFEEIYKNYFQSRIGEDIDEDSEIALFFGPPVSIRGFLKNMVKQVEDEELDNLESIEDLMNEGKSTLFDLAIVDEASMMDLPLYFLLTAFVRKDGQTILVGDHRQMQPIQKHDWENEDRITIERHTPSLSLLNFLRFLKGEDIDFEYIYRSPPDWEYCNEIEDPNEVIPMHKLEKTYRLPDLSSRILTDLFYSKDDIELESKVSRNPIPEEKLDLPDEEDHPLTRVLNPEKRVSLLIHNDKSSTCQSFIEQALVNTILNSLPSEYLSEDQGDKSSGVVTPFRIQSRDLKEITPSGVQISTVEKFQGGERDVMIISMTSSDPGYINKLTDFLLDPNRLNVAASRMKQKLIIIASESIFDANSKNVDSFEDQSSWKKLFKSMGGLKKTKKYGIESFLDEESKEIIDERDVQIRILDEYEPN